MRIGLVHVINNLEHGGAEQRVISALNGLDRTQFAPSLVCLMGTGPLRQALAPDVDVIDLEVGRRADMIGSVCRLCRLLSKTRPQIVHTHLVQAGMIGRLAARLAAVPVVITTQHNAYYPKQGSLLYRIERSTWRLADVIITLSSAIAEYVRSFKLYTGPIEVIPTGVSFDPSYLPEICSGSHPYILSVGHFRDEQKGHDILVRAFRSVLAAFPSMRLLIAGDGPKRAEISALIRSLELSNSVFLLGNRLDVDNLMKGCRAFVLASRWEGFGRVLIEAMSWGCPVVATSVEGVPEVVCQCETGVLVPPGDVEALARAMVTVLGNTKVREAFSLNARLRIQSQFLLTDMIQRETELYWRILKKRTEQ